MHVGAILKAYGAFNRSQLLLTVTTNKDIEVDVVLNKTLEQEPFAWYKPCFDGVKAIVFDSKKPDDGLWKPLYKVDEK
jgi:hypothetical protein